MVSGYADNCRLDVNARRIFNMQNWIEHARQQLQLGEALIQGGVDGLFRGWKASTEVLGKLRTGADRWHQVIHEIQAPVNLADILRARTAP